MQFEEYHKLAINRLVSKSSIINHSVHLHSIDLSWGKINFRVSIWTLPKSVQTWNGATKQVRQYAYEQHKTELLSMMKTVFGNGLEITEEPDDLSGQLYFTFTANF